MNQDHKQQQIDDHKWHLIMNAMRKLDEASKLLNQVLEGVETATREVYEVTKYISSSGNETWRAQCEDGTTLYMRQRDRELYENSGIWKQLNELDLDSTYSVRAVVETIPDGDFHKIVRVSKLYFPDLDNDGGDE